MRMSALPLALAATLAGSASLLAEETPVVWYNNTPNPVAVTIQDKDAAAGFFLVNMKNSALLAEDSCIFASPRQVAQMSAENPFYQAYREASFILPPYSRFYVTAYQSQGASTPELGPAGNFHQVVAVDFADGRHAEVRFERSVQTHDRPQAHFVGINGLAPLIAKDGERLITLDRAKYRGYHSARVDSFGMSFNPRLASYR